MRITCNGQLALAVLLTSALVFGCAEHDDNIQGLHSQDITFVPQMVSDWNAPWTRAAAADEQTSVQALQGSDEPLYLHTVVTRGIGCRQQTRGSRYIGIDKTGEEGKTFDTNDYFRVSGYSYTSGQTVADVASANFFVNTQVVYDNEWKATENFVMPAATDKTDFFAWFVADEATAGVEAVDAEGGMQLIYTVPTVIANQPDLLTAVKRGEVFSNTPGHTVPLTFNHQLTEVNFVLDTNVAPGTITEIAFTNVYTKGTLTVSDGITGTWNLTDAPLATAYTVSFATVENSVLKSNQTILGGLMMIPQKFNSEAQRIRITMTIDGISRNLYADLNGTQWYAGTSVTYKVSTSSVNVLRIGSVAYPTSWNTAEGVKAAYAPGDTIGVYGVDANGVVKLVNKKYTLDSGNWMPADGSSTLYVPGYTYYAYYPYRPSLAGAPALDNPVKVDNELPTAAQFFSGVVSNWTPATDQSTAVLLNNQDLQIARSNIATPSTPVSTVSFTMVHTMGLASIEMVSGQVPTVRYVKGTNTYSYTTATTAVTTSNSFIDNLPCDVNNNNTKHFFVVKPSTDVTFSANSTALTRWTEDKTANVAAAGYTNYQLSSPVITRGYVYKGWLYEYTGGAQTFTVPADGDYTIECWGAQGGLLRDTWLGKGSRGGYGAYTSGDLTLTQNTPLYVYVGGYGEDWGENHNSCAGGWNGGRSAYNACGGGGATDVRLSYNADCLSLTSLQSRIMVAGGGGGSNDTSKGGHAGGLVGSTGEVGTNNNTSSPSPSGGTGGTQTAAGTGANNITSNYGMDTTTGATYDGGGGGGGYYAGGQGKGNDCAGGGGSSYISGYEGCTDHTSGYVFSNTVMKAGYSTDMPQISINGGTETGHTGNGYARITSKVVE